MQENGAVVSDAQSGSGERSHRFASRKGSGSTLHALTRGGDAACLVAAPPP